MTWIVFFLVSGVTDNTAQKIIISTRTDWLPLISLKRITWLFSVSHTRWNLFFCHRYTTSNKVDHRAPRITTAYWKANYKDLYGNLSVVRSKVYIPHKELWLCCFLTVSFHLKFINAVLASFNVLVSRLLRRRQGKTGKTRLYYAARRNWAAKITFLLLQYLQIIAWANTEDFPSLKTSI